MMRRPVLGRREAKPVRSEPDPENPTPEELRAAHRRADKRIRAELGARTRASGARYVATLGHLDKRLAILDRLDCNDRSALQKISLCASDQINGTPSLPAPFLPLLENAA